MNRKTDSSKNAGMSLVELLVAVTMLAIIVVPLLHTFASSARAGLKARQNLRITTAAQDIMEGLKAESVESLSCSFNYPDDDIDGAAPATAVVRAVNSFKNFHVVSPELVRDGMGNSSSANLYELRAEVVENESLATYRNVSGLKDISALRNTNMANFGSATPADADLAATTKQTDDRMRYEFYGKSNKKYYFAIKNMQIEGGTDPNFQVDALIELDGSNYTSLGTNQKTSLDGTKKALLNDHGRISYGALNEKRDAFFIQDEQLLRQTVQEFNVKYHPQVKDCTEKDLSRKYVITTTNQTKLDPSKKAADGTSDWITVTCEITYVSSPEFLIPSNHTDYDKVPPGETPYYRSTYSYTIFDNKATGYIPDNIFLCYYPGYGAYTPDEIIYVNPHSVPSTLHIVKQEGKNNGTLNHDELNYKCEVKIHEGAGATADHNGTGGRDSSVTPIRTNLDTNLYKIYMASAPDCRNQAKFSYNGSAMTHDFANPKGSGIYTLGGDQATSDAMYDVTIDIYEKGTLDAALGSGTISNSKILFTLKGSMN